jgi:hypothetical protein
MAGVGPRVDPMNTPLRSSPLLAALATALATAGCVIPYANLHDPAVAQQPEATAEEQRQNDAQRGPPGNAARDEQKRAQRPSSSGGSGGSPSTYSLRLHNSCSKPVLLFFGNKPKFGSGRKERLGTNTTTSYSGGAPQTVWIIDESENGLSSFVASGSQSVQITSSCTGFSSY